MARMTENVIVTGAKNRPPMLEKGMYDSWKNRIMLYVEGKKNDEMLIDSIKNRPFQLKEEITIPASEGVPKHKRPQTLFDLTLKENTSISSRFPLTNNQLKTSSNPRTQATVQDGRVTIQNIQGRQSQGYGVNMEKSQATGIRVINIVGYVNANQPRVSKCHNCKGEGHIAKQCCNTPKMGRSEIWVWERYFIDQ
ncbi:retrovirus-related pol polyprotein from transposon TNT 1-94 [Tanacetum coccineum]